MIAALSTQARFLFLLVPRLMTGQCTPSRLAGYAIELTACGSRRLGAWCWKRAIRDCAYDEPMYDAVLDVCIRAGKFDAAEEFASGFYDTSGLSPAAGLKLAGNLVLDGAYESARRVFGRLLRECGDVVDLSPSPSWGDEIGGDRLHKLLTTLATGKVTDTEIGDLALGFARLCFSFGSFDTSARLFEKARAEGILDRIAEAYALLRSDRLEQVSLDIDSCSAPPDADWRILQASVLFACGDASGAAAAVRDALSSRFHAHPDLNRMIADCNDIVAALAGSPAMIGLSPDGAADIVENGEAGLRKIFVCGIGWSGSGALYDALTEYDGLAEMPHAPGDRFLNDCTGNEMMFVQGPAGLGHIWRTASEEQTLRRSDLWDLFRCHVAGAGAIGYVEYKSAKAALNLMKLVGDRYTGIFKRMFAALSRLRDGASLSTVQRILNVGTESLIAGFAGDRAAVLFNNAVFGPNLDMLAIFGNFRAAVVTRDPLDVYADRKVQDLKHWMTPARFVPFYEGRRKIYHARRTELPPDLAEAVREIEFERFVLDEAYRQAAIDWLVHGIEIRHVRRRFEPAQSVMNVGLHKRLLSVDERSALETELGRWKGG